jgi:hypothetical protein
LAPNAPKPGDPLPEAEPGGPVPNRPIRPLPGAIAGRSSDDGWKTESRVAGGGLRPAGPLAPFDGALPVKNGLSWGWMTESMLKSSAAKCISQMRAKRWKCSQNHVTNQYNINEQSKKPIPTNNDRHKCARDNFTKHVYLQITATW